MENNLESILKHNGLTYDALSEEYEEKAGLRVEKTSEIIEKVTPFFKTNGHILDVGCGVGITTEKLLEKGFQVTAVDISSKMLAYTQKRNPQAHCVLGDFLTLDFDTRFDGILDFAFLHLFPKETAMEILQKNYEILHPEGIFFIGTTVSDKNSEGWEEKEDYSKKHKRYRKHWKEDELKEALQKVGFEILKVDFNTGDSNKRWINIIARK